MIGFIRAHGYIPGPTQRPLMAGALTGLLATIPAAFAFVGFGSFDIAADAVMQLPRAWTAVLVLAAFTLAGVLYGAFFQRAANDRRAGWLLGMSYSFVLWIAAPVVALPLMRGSTMAAGAAATGFFVTFLCWGLVAGLLFPYVHQPLQAHLGGEGDGRETLRLGPGAVTFRERLLRRPG